MAAGEVSFLKCCYSGETPPPSPSLCFVGAYAAGGCRTAFSRGAMMTFGNLFVVASFTAWRLDGLARLISNALSHSSVHRWQTWHSRTGRA